MQIMLESQYELLQSLIDGTISFKDECNTREIVNLLCQSCIDSSDEIDIYSFFGSSSAGDIDELLIEELQYNGWDVEWFDLFATGIDVVALSEAITATHFVPYSKDEIESFIFDFLENWKSNTMKYIHVQLTGNREE